MKRSTVLRLGVLISGRGSNMESIIKACMSDEFPAEVACVISNNVNAPGLKIAETYGVDTFTVSRKPLDTKGISSILEKHCVDLVCLAGFMSILDQEFVSHWNNKIINIHPSLLPSFVGLRAQLQAFDAGVKIAGCTVHYVHPELDSGPIIMQAAVPVLRNDDVNSLSARILAAEHICYPRTIRAIASGNVTIDSSGKVSYSGEDELFFFHTT
ncbi:phosphoribosylglycinamide formyltransferase [Anaplasma bovis]|uniref:phosphoribosylglycinamide formyltransferase n=1 Tax=Anaplasma bovis TaxID=186733 RepID=UPI002FEE8970